MKDSMPDDHLKEAAALIRAVQNVMRRFIRLLVGRISLARLQELIRLVYVEEAEAYLKRQKPGKNVSMTNMALLTGIDTRTLGKVRGESEAGVPVYEKNQFLKEITPECSVLDYWQVNPEFIDQNARPLELPLHGPHPSFESLVAETVTSRGITINSLLERLKATRSIEIDQEKKTVKMLDGRYWPFQQEDDKALIEIGMISMSNLVDTVNHNLKAMQGEEEPFFHRSTWTTRLSLEHRPELRAAVRKLLTASEEEVTRLFSAMEDAEERKGQVTAGVGIYYFEEEHQQADGTD